MIAENLKIVEAKIAEKCEILGRNREEIRLIAVSKKQSADVIKQAFSAGLMNFGENKAQELRDKVETIDLNVSWHFIGHVQTNKVKYIVGPAEYIHSVDSLKLAEEINRKAAQSGTIQKVLIEIKTSDEATKYGLSSDTEIMELLEGCSKLPNINVEGFMTMAPYTDDTAVIRGCFRRVIEKGNFASSRGFKIREFSMGMTNDYEIAIEEGATMLRIGTAIFGDRN